MKARLREMWFSRSLRERVVVAVLVALAGAVLYVWLVQSAERARAKLRTTVSELKSQAVRVEQQAAEMVRLQAVLPAVVSQTDLPAMARNQAAASGISRALLRVDAPETNRAIVVFGSVPFQDWLSWVAALQKQHVHVENARIEAQSQPGLVSVTAALTRTR
jgi:general secretion pathway protein M